VVVVQGRDASSPIVVVSVVVATAGFVVVVEATAGLGYQKPDDEAARADDIDSVSSGAEETNSRGGISLDMFLPQKSGEPVGRSEGRKRRAPTGPWWWPTANRPSEVYRRQPKPSRRVDRPYGRLRACDGNQRPTMSLCFCPTVYRATLRLQFPRSCPRWSRCYADRYLSFLRNASGI
jgi:hypothetical protein